MMTTESQQRNIRKTNYITYVEYYILWWSADDNCMLFESKYQL